MGKITEPLNLPSHILPAEILVFGYPASQPKPASQKDLDEIVFYGAP